MSTIVFVDTETTGLDRSRHYIWEVAALEYDLDVDMNLQDRPRMTWQLELAPHQIATADATALRICRFYERYDRERTPRSPGMFAEEYVRWTANRHVVGAVPDFDAYRLEDLVRSHGFAPAWHYHLIDIETLVVGFRMGIAATLYREERPVPFNLPWDSRKLAEQVGVKAVSALEHTAEGDVLWAAAQLDAIRWWGREDIG